MFLPHVPRVLIISFGSLSSIPEKEALECLVPADSGGSGGRFLTWTGQPGRTPRRVHSIPDEASSALVISVTDLM